MEEKCTFNDENKNCNCILHNKNTNKSLTVFNEAIERIIKENKDELILSDIIFPDNFEYQSVFSKHTNIQFIDCEFNKKMIHLNIESICYTQCHFKNNIWFFDKKDISKTDNIYNLCFDYCTFEEEFNCDFYADNMPRCNITALNIQNSTFKKSIKFNKCNINSSYMFSNNTIFGTSDFGDITFKEAYFIRNKFNDVVSFKQSYFDSFTFKENTFDKLAIFEDTTFKSKLNLKGNIFKDEINFLGIKNENGKSLETANIVNRETARIIKHSFEKLDNIIEANKFYALEMQKREEELSKEKNWLDLIVFKFHKISSNHSQDWLLSLLWVINLTFVYTSFQFIEALDSHWLFLYSFLSIGLIITSIEGLAYLEIPKDYKGLFCVIFIFLNWIFYSLITNDYTMCYASNNFNPFSIMMGKESLTFGTLIYKLIIAYLIYQFIISIRQNTRRK